MAAAHPAFTELTYRAFSGSCEVTVSQLMGTVAFESTDYLDRLPELGRFLDASGLELRPPIHQGESDDVRLLVYANRQRGFAENLKQSICFGEQSKIEYKSTLFVSVRRVREGGEDAANCLDEGVIHSSLKTICGYLNKDGGELYVGVEPSGNICGIELDYAVLSRKQRDFDGWVNRVLDLIGARFHESHLVKNYLDIDMEPVDGCPVVRIVVRPREKVSFVKDVEGAYHCYVRTSARIQEIYIQDLPEFMASRKG